MNVLTYRPDINARAYSTPNLETRRDKLQKLEADKNQKPSAARVQELNVIRTELANRAANNKRAKTSQKTPHHA